MVEEVTVNVQVWSMAHVSSVTVTLPVEVTASEKITSISITSPTVYIPLDLSELTAVIVGGIIQLP